MSTVHLGERGPMTEGGLIVFGNWRLRHAEPVPQAQRQLRVLQLPVRAARRGAQVDCRGEHPLVALWSDAGWQDLMQGQSVGAEGGGVEGAGAGAGAEGGGAEGGEGGGVRGQGRGAQRIRCHNVDADWVPLAHVAVDQGLVQIRHLVDRADGHVAHFIEPPSPVPPCTPQQLYDTLCTAFEANHLKTNNYECFYAVHAELESLNILIEPAPQDVLALGDAWLDLLGSADESHFVAQIGEELAHACHDNLLCTVLPNLEGVQGWVNAALYSRKRCATVLEPLAQFGAVLRSGEQGPWRTQRHADQPLGQAVALELAQHFDLPLQPALRWRRTQMASGCESLETGHLFDVRFSLCQPMAPSSDAPVLACEVDYLRTRGSGTAASAAQEQQALAQRLLHMLQALGLRAQLSPWRGPGLLYARLATVAQTPLLQEA